MWIASALGLLLLSQAPSAYERIVAKVGQEPAAELCAELESFVSTHPGDPDAGRALIWLGQHYRTAGDDARATEAFLRARRDHPGTEWGLAGTKGLADLALADRRYGDASDLFAELTARPEPLWQYLGRQGLAEASTGRRLWLVFLFAVALLLALNPGRVLLARAPLWPAPPEALYVLPVFALLALAALAQPAAEARAVLWVSIGGLWLVLCNAAFFRARPPAGLARYRELLLGILQTAALLYCAIIASGLWQKLVDTVAMGPE